jgi:hypothetical protein
MTIKETLYQMMDDLPAGRYGMWDLTDKLNSITGARTQPHQVKRYCKQYADASGSDFICVVPNKSIFEYVPNCKIAGSFVDK